MTIDKLDSNDFYELIERLRALPTENEWVEFEENNEDPKLIGEIISALSNSAAIAGEPMAFAVWGISDQSHLVTGTKFDPFTKKVCNEDFIPWVRRLVSPNLHFEFQKEDVDGEPVVLLRINAARETPTRFKSDGYVRVGSYSKLLTRQPQLERMLFRSFETFTFEEQYAKSFLEPVDVVQLIDYPAYFKLNELPLPESRSEILDHLEAAGLVELSTEKKWSITNLGALLYAGDLNHFPHLNRKIPRAVVYKGDNRVETLREFPASSGYAVSYTPLIEFVMNSLPENEVIQHSGIRESLPLIPRIVVRELVANALLHQDLLDNSIAPMVEVFDNRLEITNPGRPLIDPLRFIDSPSRSRNPKLGDGFRRVGMVEEKGSGWDKIAFALEVHQLPAAQIIADELSTKVVVYGPTPLTAMSKEERVIAVYQHACLNYVSEKDTNNGSIRKRFGIAPKNKSQASRIIREARDSKLIVPFDETVGAKSLRYVPFWAKK